MATVVRSAGNGGHARAVTRQECHCYSPLETATVTAAAMNAADARGGGTKSGTI